MLNPCYILLIYLIWYFIFVTQVLVSIGGIGIYTVTKEVQLLSSIYGN